MQERVLDTGTRFQSQGAVSKQQLALLDEAQEACHAAKATLGWSGLKSDDRGASLASHLDSLMANFDTLNKLVDLRVRVGKSQMLRQFCKCPMLFVDTSGCFRNS